jgi:choline dehydrogenase-like flavoprotein
MEETFDYVVVGGGSSGCIVAAELAADPSLRVLLLEHGQRAEDNPETLRADGYKQAFINDRVIWERFSEPQKEAAGHRVFMGSGRGLGGSGSVNAMVYTRGSESDYALWNLDGWSWRDLLPHFEALEKKLDVRRQPPTQFTESCIRAAEGAGFRRKEDLNDGDLSGVLGYEWMNHRGADRRSSYVSFLKPLLDAGRANLTVRTQATARRVLFDGKRAVGVECQRGGGGVEVARARREIVLSAGALETPKLLMLSGVGPAGELRRHGIAQVADVPAVGRNLMDHPNVVLFFKGRRDIDCSFPQLYGFHRANPSTALPPGQSDTCYVFYAARSSFKEGVIRLLPSMILPPALYKKEWLRRGLRGAISTVFSIKPVQSFVERMYGIVVILGKPKSRGSVTLRSGDVRDQAILDPAYFQEREDLDTLLAGVQLARRVAGGMSEWGNFELMPGRRANLEDWVRKNVMTTYHFAGTCRMGADAASVVDARLRVRAVERLRVADASVIPFVPVSAMNAPSMMIGLRASRFIAEERAAETPRPTAKHAEA